MNDDIKCFDCGFINEEEDFCLNCGADLKLEMTKYSLKSKQSAMKGRELSVACDKKEKAKISMINLKIPYETSKDTLQNSSSIVSSEKPGNTGKDIIIDKDKDRKGPNYLLSILFGLVVALIGSFIWGGVALVLNKKFVCLPIGIGYCVAMVMATGAGKIDIPLQVTGAIFILISVFFGDIFFYCGTFTQMTYLDVILNYPVIIMNNVSDLICSAGCTLLGIACFIVLTERFKMNNLQISQNINRCSKRETCYDDAPDFIAGFYFQTLLVILVLCLVIISACVISFIYGINSSTIIGLSVFLILISGCIGFYVLILLLNKSFHR
ncbi:MAG: hypothetical protein ABRQ37_03400 [Candidatus Eremiobacterota bacterium]